MDNIAFNNVCNYAEQIIKGKSPYRTGNLRFNAIKGTLINQNIYELKIDQHIAPYMVFTNEPWVSPKWNGKKNPNEKWFDNAAYFLAKELAKRLNGKLVIKR